MTGLHNDACLVGRRSADKSIPSVSQIVFSWVISLLGARDVVSRGQRREPPADDGCFSLSAKRLVPVRCTVWFANHRSQPIPSQRRSPYSILHNLSSLPPSRSAM